MTKYADKGGWQVSHARPYPQNHHQRKEGCSMADMSPEKLAEMDVVIADYEKTGNPALLAKLRTWCAEYGSLETDEPVIMRLKKLFHF
jgi:hypothetical protein